MKSLPIPRSTLFTVAAFLVAPLVAAFGLSLASAVRAGSPQFKVAEVLVWTFIFYFYAAWATVLLGLPSFVVLRRLGAIHWWSATIAGSLVGVLVIVFIDPRGLSVVGHQGTVLWAGVGAVSAFAFWLIWRQGQDSRSGGT